MGINIFLTLCNIASVVTYCLETVPSDGGDELDARSVWFGWEAFFMTIFTLEFICRAPAHTTLKQFVFRRPEVFVDFLACVPFDLYLFAHLHWSWLDTRWIRPVRLLRVVSLGYLILDLKLILTGIRRSLRMLLLVWCLTILVLFTFASILFMAERGPWSSAKGCYLDYAGNCAKFDSVPTSLYFSLEVVSSLGYGDIVPTSGIGTLITTLLMLVSVSILATTVAVFSMQFETVYQKVKRSTLLDNLREAADLELRMAVFEGSHKDQIATREAACRLVAGIEALQAIAGDLARTTKAIRAELVFLSLNGTKGARAFNPNIAAKCEMRKRRLARITEQSLAELAAAAYNDVDTLMWYSLTSAEELFVKAVESYNKTTYDRVADDSP
jgi:voltage-gated potassium channel